MSAAAGTGRRASTAQRVALGVAAVVAGLATMASCAGVAALVGRAGSEAPSAAAPPQPVPAPSPEPSEPAEPAPPVDVDYAAPRPDRPVVGVTLALAPDLSSATGTEQVLFTPDLPVCELVFRLWPNKPEAAAGGNELVVTSAAVDGVAVTPVVDAAGAPPGTTGTLVELPVDGCAEPGEPVRTELAFSLRLGEDSTERVGWSRTADMAWMATAVPLLAWEHGQGWMRTPAVDLFGEMAGSETFALERLEVSAPSGYQVMGTGALAGAPSDDGTVAVHTFTADAVRDLAVVVGDLEVVETDVEGVGVHLAVPAGVSTAAGAQDWLGQQVAWLGEVAAYLGPYPYTDLWVTVVPSFPTGVEFPGAIFYGDVDPLAFPELVPHETAHMWLYGLVGNDQGRDPWLDEGFTSFVEAHVVGAEAAVASAPLPPAVQGHLGWSMERWTEEGSAAGDLYGAGVYQQGAAVLARARAAAGPEAFDAALREYVATSAHTITRPEDVEEAFAGAPAALDVMREAGAFDGDEGD